MKKILTSLIVLVLFSCNIAQQYLKKGQYHLATHYAVKKLMKNKNHEKSIQILMEAYPKAIKNSLDRIEYLHTEGRPDRWEEIFSIYSELAELQKKVENLYPIYLNGKEIRFQHYDYNEKIVEAKVKAADYFYHNAKKLYAKKTKWAYREAFEQFRKAITYSPAYQDADLYMDSCYILGQAHLLLIAVNNTPFKLSNDFMINLIDLPPNEFNSFWHKYHKTDDLKGNYDAFIYVILNKVLVSPGEKTVREFTQTAEVTEGWEYKVDSTGKVVKDSLGNPIKVPKKKIVSCLVKETRLFKKARIEGLIEYRDAKTKELILSIPIGADNIFEYFYYNANGDLRALSNDIRAKLDLEPKPFPHDIDMIYAANETLKNVIFSVLKDHRNFVINRW